VALRVKETNSFKVLKEKRDDYLNKLALLKEKAG